MDQKKEKFSSFSHAIKFISGIISWTVLVILVIIALFLLYYFVSTKMYAEKGEKYKPAFSLYTILSPSMVPNINVYDVIVDINVTKPEDIKVGDVITFNSTATLTTGMTITHRVVDIKTENGVYTYLTQGDANVSPDGAYVPFDHIYGKVLFRIPQLGRLQEFLGTKGGWLIVVVIPALLIIISDLLKIFRLRTAKKEVEGYAAQETVKRKREKLYKEKIEKQLVRRYTNERRDAEPDPLPKKIYSILDLLPKVVTLDLPKKIDLPKLVEKEEQNNPVEEVKKTKPKARKKRKKKKANK